MILKQLLVVHCKPSVLVMKVIFLVEDFLLLFVFYCCLAKVDVQSNVLPLLNILLDLLCLSNSQIGSLQKLSSSHYSRVLVEQKSLSSRLCVLFLILLGCRRMLMVSGCPSGSL